MLNTNLKFDPRIHMEEGVCAVLGCLKPVDSNFTLRDRAMVGFCGLAHWDTYAVSDEDQRLELLKLQRTSEMFLTAEQVRAIDAVLANVALPAPQEPEPNEPAPKSPQLARDMTLRQHVALEIFKDLAPRYVIDDDVDGVYGLTVNLSEQSARVAMALADAFLQVEAEKR